MHSAEEREEYRNPPSWLPLRGSARLSVATKLFSTSSFRLPLQSGNYLANSLPISILWILFSASSWWINGLLKRFTKSPQTSDSWSPGREGESSEELLLFTSLARKGGRPLRATLVCLSSRQRPRQQPETVPIYSVISGCWLPVIISLW